MNQQSIGTAIDQIELLLEQIQLSNQQRAKLLLDLAEKYQPTTFSPRQEFYDQLQTEDFKSLTKLDYSPQAQEFRFLRKISEFSEGNVSAINSNLHRLSSELDEISARESQKKRKSDDKKRKLKQKMKNYILEVGKCLEVMLQSLFKSFTHLMSVKCGKNTKFQVQAVYLNTLKRYLQDYQNKEKQPMHFEQSIDESLRFCQLLAQKVPLFSSKFIDPSEEVVIPLPSRLFNTIIKCSDLYS